MSEEGRKRRQKTVESLNETLLPMIVQLDHMRRPRVKQDPGQEGVRVVDAGSPLVMADEPKRVLPSLAFCTRCRNVGYVRANVPFGDPLFGKALECECKKQRKKEAQRLQLREQSKIDQLAGFQDESFETFQFWLAGVSQAFQEAAQWADALQGWLVMQGPNGCGKTHLAIAIAKRCLDNGAAVLFATVPDLLDYLRAAFSPNTEVGYDDEFQKMREAEVLILDDLGAEQSTAWANEKLFQLLNHRYNAHLPTVVTTNCIDLSGIAPRLRSRLRDRRLVQTVVMDAQDFREME
jgi:DNA replication protein DnaC